MFSVDVVVTVVVVVVVVLLVVVAVVVVVSVVIVVVAVAVVYHCRPISLRHSHYLADVLSYGVQRLEVIYEMKGRNKQHFLRQQKHFWTYILFEASLQI